MDFFWENDGWEAADPHLTQLKSGPFRRNFPPTPKKPGIYAIRGPRQIGKSSWLKTILSAMASKTSCFYLSCENIRDHVELAEILKSVQSRKYILLDEITFVKDWARAIKHAADAGDFHILVLTGSHSADLRRGMDRMPGRWGNGGEFSLLPMTFEEVLAARKEAQWRPAQESHYDALVHYFHCGGFPPAVVEVGNTAQIPHRSLTTYRQWLAGDFTRFGKQELYLRELLLQIALTMGSSISTQKLAQRTQIGSHHTVQEYLELLEDCFALRTCFAIDSDTGGFRFRKEKKFYFTDPLLYWLAFEWGGMPPDSSAHERLAEMVAHEALTRRYQRFGYFHSQRGGEIDFFAPHQWALEVKWASIASNLSKAYKDCRLAKKLVWTQNNLLNEWL